MSDRSIVHNTFVIKRTYPVPPRRVFAAWADPKIKAEWFGDPNEKRDPDGEFDFRVGGREISSGKIPAGEHYRYSAIYQDIVPDQRIVYSYDMEIDGVRLSVSLATIELEADGSSTRLTLTEQGAYLDGNDKPSSREEGTNALLDQLGALLKKQ